jgi:hypothetical protein
LQEEQIEKLPLVRESALSEAGETDAQRELRTFQGDKTMHAIKDMFVTGNAHELQTPARGIR